MNKRPHVLISGAGIGGLTAALSLLRKGFDCDVYEHASELREVGAGLWLSYNGARVLFALGLEQDLGSHAIEFEERLVRLWNTGQSWQLYKRAPGAPVAYQPYALLRAHLLHLLGDAVEKLKPGAIHLNARCIGFDQNEHGVELQLDGGSVSGDVLVGADGVHSRVRDSVVGPVQSHYTKAIAWRGLVPMERLSKHQRRYIQVNWLGPNAHCTVYPVRWQGSELLTFSGQIETETWEAESWSQKGDVAECVRDFVGWHEDVVEMVSNVDTLHKWGLFVRDPLPHWSVGRVTLLGDACHSMVPYLGQGVNTAIEDAYVLARCLEQQPDEPSQALLRYQAARMTRANHVVSQSLAMQPVLHNPALADSRTASDYVSRLWSPAEFKARQDWIYGYDATKVPV